MAAESIVSEKHANFIINIQNATGKDVRNLIELIKNRVKEETNIDLILEQEYKDWWLYENKESEKKENKMESFS